MKIKKRFLKIFFLILTILLTYIIYIKNNHSNINYTSLGDGFALGINSYGNIDYGYSDYLKEYLNEKNLLNKYNKNFTSKTNTITNLYNDILINKKIKKEYIKHTLRESDIITLSIGLNDLLFKISIENELNTMNLNKIFLEIKKEYNLLIKEIYKYYHNKIYVIGYYTTDINNKFLTNNIRKLNKILSSNKTVTFININKTFIKNPKYISNPRSFYPNYLGYQAITKKIIYKINKKT